LDKEPECKYKNVTIRIHGTADQSKVKDAATLFLKKVVYQKARNGVEKTNEETQ